jgi:hypothetical protein
MQARFRTLSFGAMNDPTSRPNTALCLLLALTAFSIGQPATAQSTPTQVHTSPQQDPGVYSGRLKVDYPTPYEPATIEDIQKVLERVHAYVDTAAPVQVVDGDTGAPVPDLAKLPPQVALARTDLQILTYEWGVTYAGMLRTAEVTGDKRYTDYTDTRVSAIAMLAAHAKQNLPAGHDRVHLHAAEAWPRLSAASCSRARSTIPVRCARR